jgi:hypothetical protein
MPLSAAAAHHPLPVAARGFARAWSSRSKARGWNIYLIWTRDGLLRHTGGERSMVEG